MSADALQLEVSAVELHHLTAVGSAPGVVLLLVAGRNGPGMAWLRTSGDGNVLAWRAPGSATFGPDVVCESDGTYILTDGEDEDRFVRVQAWRNFLIQAGDFPVYLSDRYANGAALDDVTAERAAAGDVSVWTITLRNSGQTPISALAVWLDAASDASIELSADGQTWSAAADESEAVKMGHLAADATATVHLRRTVAAGCAASPKQTMHLCFAFDGAL